MRRRQTSCPTSPERKSAPPMWSSKLSRRSSKRNKPSLASSSRSSRVTPSSRPTPRASSSKTWPRFWSTPDRFVGLHFFNPVARLPLVEVISGTATRETTAARAMSFVTQIGKLPLPCRSAPGFVVNRILAPYMLEALRAHEEGRALEEVDEAAEAFGMPMGPIELADRVGLDVAQHVSTILGAATGRRVPESLRLKVEAGHLGAKSGQGFYRYENDHPIKVRHRGPTHKDLGDRLILTLLNEAVACCEDGVVGRLRPARCRSGLWGWVCAVPGRPSALRKVARHRNSGRAARGASGQLRRAIHAPPGLAEARAVMGCADFSPGRVVDCAAGARSGPNSFVLPS